MRNLAKNLEMRMQSKKKIKKYRIVTDSFSGFQVQKLVTFLWMKKWSELSKETGEVEGFNTFLSLAEARDFMDRCGKGELTKIVLEAEYND